MNNRIGDDMLVMAKTRPEPGAIELGQRRVREPGPGEMLVEIKAAGLCGTDMQIHRWPPWLAKRMKLPVVLGHEACGIVAATGEGVTSVSVGDYVSFESHAYCGHCYQCLTDKAHLCVEKFAPGVDADGVFAEFATLPANIAWRNPPDLPHHLGAIMEPFGIAVHASLEGAGASSLSVVINGCGPIGLMNVAVARALGADRVIAVEPNPVRRETARALGADRLIDPVAEPVKRAVDDVTRGRGADVVIEYSGQPEGWHNCLEMLTPGGEIRVCATPSYPMEYDFTAWKAKRPTFINIHGRRIWSTWVKASALITDPRIDLAPVISHVLPLKEGPAAFDLVINGEAVKPILIP